MLGSFNSNGVRYCIVGAYAVGYHARPRYTKDMDILVEPQIDNARRILKSLREFGFGSLPLSEEDFSREGRIIQLGYEPVRIDLITSIAGCSFEGVWKNRVRGRYGKERAYFIGLRDLMRSKKASRRKQDKADLELLLAASRRKKARSGRRRKSRR